ncbi:hypothetical protein LTR37_011370 [Vermiconidia calcicola]|uniref:Uncharacterized protein n=1 Tax=Vermiconidia calcicola TaxID=1690605 RepID=A0ACC3N3H9_9PEZI|nr:hypothetical protein LTR37_011370 [Vermiconidia calcicola]
MCKLYKKLVFKECGHVVANHITECEDKRRCDGKPKVKDDGDVRNRPCDKCKKKRKAEEAIRAERKQQEKVEREAQEAARQEQRQEQIENKKLEARGYRKEEKRPPKNKTYEMVRHKSDSKGVEIRYTRPVESNRRDDPPSPPKYVDFRKKSKPHKTATKPSGSSHKSVSSKTEPLNDYEDFGRQGEASTGRTEDEPGMKTRIMLRSKACMARQANQEVMKTPSSSSAVFLLTQLRGISKDRATLQDRRAANKIRVTTPKGGYEQTRDASQASVNRSGRHVESSMMAQVVTKNDEKSVPYPTQRSQSTVPSVAPSAGRSGSSAQPPSRGRSATPRPISPPPQEPYARGEVQYRSRNRSDSSGSRSGSYTEVEEDDREDVEGDDQEDVEVDYQEDEESQVTLVGDAGDDPEKKKKKKVR